MPSVTQTARLEARISTELHAMLKRAAEIQGRTMTDFIISGCGPTRYRTNRYNPTVPDRSGNFCSGITVTNRAE